MRWSQPLCRKVSQLRKLSQVSSSCQLPTVSHPMVKTSMFWRFMISLHLTGIHQQHTKSSLGIWRSMQLSQVRKHLPTSNCCYSLLRWWILRQPAQLLAMLQKSSQLTQSSLIYSNQCEISLSEISWLIHMTFSHFLFFKFFYHFLLSSFSH